MDFTVRKKGKDFWGPYIWAMIHLLAIIIDSKKSIKDRNLLGVIYIEFLWLLTHLLPCQVCKVNLIAKLNYYDIEGYVKGGKAFQLTYILHDAANKHINQYANPKKEKVSPPYNDVLNYYVKNMKKGKSYWGPIVWKVIHILPISLEMKNMVHYKRFLEILGILLPDIESRKNVNDFLKKYPIDKYLRNSNDLFYYTYIFHYMTNEMLGKNNPYYPKVKYYYYTSMGEYCSDCRV